MSVHIIRIALQGPHFLARGNIPNANGGSAGAVFFLSQIATDGDILAVGRQGEPTNADKLRAYLAPQLARGRIPELNCIPSGSRDDVFSIGQKAKPDHMPTEDSGPEADRSKSSNGAGR